MGKRTRKKLNHLLRNVPDGTLMGRFNRDGMSDQAPSDHVSWDQPGADVSGDVKHWVKLYEEWARVPLDRAIQGGSTMHGQHLHITIADEVGRYESEPEPKQWEPKPVVRK